MEVIQIVCYGLCVVLSKSVSQVKPSQAIQYAYYLSSFSILDLTFLMGKYSSEFPLERKIADFVKVKSSF